MKSFIKILSVSALLIGANVAFLSGCASTSTKESTGEYIDDSTITTKVKAAFVKDEVVKARQVNVETYKGVVQLSGFVATPEEKARAERLAASVGGVTSVSNKIEIK
jgi:hyperosmotically inducible protein